MSLRGADEVLFVPTDELVSASLGGDLTPNRSPAKSPATRRRKKKQSIDEAALTLYDGYAGFLVRTAVLRADDYDQDDAPTVRTADDAFTLCRHLAFADQEHLVVLALNNSLRLLAIHETAIGGSSSVTAQLQHVVKVPLLVSARVVILVHNHPSGSSDPSADDKAMTRVIKSGLECIQIQLVDHIIITRRGFSSFADLGLL